MTSKPRYQKFRMTFKTLIQPPMWKLGSSNASLRILWHHHHQSHDD